MESAKSEAGRVQPDTRAQAARAAAERNMIKAVSALTNLPAEVQAEAEAARQALYDYLNADESNKAAAYSKAAEQLKKSISTALEAEGLDKWTRQALEEMLDNIDSEAEIGDNKGQDIESSGNLKGPVEFTPPQNATPEQIAQTKAYIDGANEALKSGALSSEGRVSTKGILRRQASRAANTERKRAAAAGIPYKGHVSHVPDTTWTNSANPYSWLDLEPSVNTSLGGQVKQYPIGYKPTKFVYKER